MEENYDIMPKGMLNNAKDWELIYRQNILSKNHNLQITAVYCLLTALEMYLKAYLIFLDKKFGKTNELKKISHSFIKIYKVYETLNEKMPNGFITELKYWLDYYHIYIDDYSLLRYPKRGDKFNFQDLFTGNHKLNFIFSFIEEEIKKISS